MKEYWLSPGDTKEIQYMYINIYLCYILAAIIFSQN